jgi:hypothetical protein
MRTRDQWREYIVGRAELHCRLLKLLGDDAPLATVQPAGLATLLGTLCAELTHRASVSERPQDEVERGIETVLWRRIRDRDEREAA